MGAQKLLIVWLNQTQLGQSSVTTLQKKKGANFRSRSPLKLNVPKCAVLRQPISMTKNVLNESKCTISRGQEVVWGQGPDLEEIGSYLGPTMLL